MSTQRGILRHGAGLVSRNTVAATLVLAALRCDGQSCFPVPAGLVSWWQAEGDATDVTGANQGIIENSVHFVGGEVGQSFYCDGQGGHVRVPDAPSLRFTTAMTVEAWVYPTRYGYPNTTIVSKWDAVAGINQRSYGFALLPTGALSFGGSSDGISSTASVSSAGFVPLNQWTHVAGTYDGASLKVYLNGVLDAAAAYSRNFFPGTGDLGIGGDVGGEPPGGVVAPFSGCLDEVSLYSRALSAGEIQSIYDAGNTGKCLPQPPLTIQCTKLPDGLMLSWPMSATGYDLETSTDLTSTNWTVVTGSLTPSGTDVLVTVPYSGPQQYYRLHHP